MIPVEQRLLFNAETGERGDCLKCCLATLLERGYEEVPHFAAMGDRWHLELTAWLRSEGWMIGNAWHSIDPDDPRKLNGWTTGYWLAGVVSLRTRPDGEHLGHMVLMRDGEIVWDPHPDRQAGHLGFDGTGWLLLPLDPARFTYLREAA